MISIVVFVVALCSFYAGYIIGSNVHISKIRQFFDAGLIEMARAAIDSEDDEKIRFVIWSESFHMLEDKLKDNIYKYECRNGTYLITLYRG